MRNDELADLGLIAIGRAVQSSRQAAGLSQRRLANACGIDQGSISRLERGLLPGIRIARVARLIATLGRLEIVWVRRVWIPDDLLAEDVVRDATTGITTSG